jgi:hypothetical protein
MRLILKRRLSQLSKASGQKKKSLLSSERRSKKKNLQGTTPFGAEQGKRSKKKKLGLHRVARRHV